MVTYQEFLQRNAGDPAAAFFELANQKRVKYTCIDGAVLDIGQDPSVEDCTGGIVWETSFLLATFLEAQFKRDKKGKRPRVLEVGAGCGLLGLALAHAGCDVTLTEAPPAMPNLRANVAANKGVGCLEKAQKPRAMQLSWESIEEREACRRVAGGGFDLIVGTDVVFAKRLVEPLLQTMHALVAEGGTVWLCLQERCPDAHAALLRMGKEYFDVEDCTAQLSATPGCEAAAELECVLLRMRAGAGGGEGGGAHTRRKHELGEDAPAEKEKKKRKKRQVG